MNEKYIVTDEYLKEKGLDLNDYALDGTLVPAIKNVALDILVSRVCYLDDSLNGETSIEERLGDDTNKIATFYKAQYRVVFNLIFQNETNPLDPLLDNIIVHELKWGKINGWQKGIYYKHA